MKISTVIMIFLTAILVSCTSTKSQWPHGMTPFFAECQTDMKVYTDRAYAERKRMPCTGGWKFYDRGEPTLTND